MKCPFCKEEIIDGAIKCKHCGSMLGQQPIQQSNLKTEKSKNARIIIIIVGIISVLGLLFYTGILGSEEYGYEVVKEGHLQFFGNDKTVGEVLQHIADGTVAWSAAEIVSPKEYKKSHYLTEAKFSILKKAIEKQPILAMYLGGMSKEIILNIQFLVEKEAPNFSLYSGSLNDISISAEKMLGLVRDMYVLKNMMVEEEKEEEQKNKRKNAALELHNIATGIESYRAETGTPPDKLDILVPVHLSSFPVNDPWGNKYIYQKNSEHAGIASCGSDGVFKGFDQASPNGSSEDGEDIIIVDGAFINEPVDFSAPPIIENNEQDSSQSFLISDKKVLGLSRGMTVAEVEQIIGKENVRVEKEEKSIEGEIYEELYVKVFLSGETQPILKALLSEEGKIGLIYVLDRRCKTAENISVDSTFGEIKRAYPDLQFEWHEGYYVWSEQARYSFELADKGTEPTDASKIINIGL